ncbi:conserved hypothetical protein [uncultured Desulfobacterium sp.]|uniref:4Fe-4S ferredoxin-type domain-containing protein n=1 Tax=uncultured Desulfobacterium sp. TaxID=201089 RepID=A0A445MQP6_9BACT|nr:conserved hypothetical protein [uncultured Desulfobacterium sp.]
MDWSKANEVKGHRITKCFNTGKCPNKAIIAEGLFQELEKLMSKKELRSFLIKRIEGPLKLHHEFRISISDCPNACSRPQIADIGLIGACIPRVTDNFCNECGLCAETCKENAISLIGNRPRIIQEKCLYCGQCVDVCQSGALSKGKVGYRIQVGGKLGRHPRLGQELPGIYDPEETLKIIDRCVEYYKIHCHEGERLGEIIEKIGVNLP